MLLNLWQKCVWVGAALLIVVSLLSLTHTAETSSPAGSTGASTAGTQYYSFQDSGRAETHYVVRDGDRSVVYNSMPAGR